MANAFVGTGKRLSAEDLAKVEGRIGLTLPPSLIALPRSDDPRVPIEIPHERPLIAADRA